ncbi:MAG: hypothetical protein J6B71_08330 [Clostridia bacterium]|nr:hypothetical protein [Clostridia bacterium]
MNHEIEKWHRLSADAVVEQLHTYASCGLSRKEAGSRYRKQGPNTLFDAPQDQPIFFLKPLLTDPAILLVLFVSLLCLCFSAFFSGLLSLAMLLLGFLFAARLLFLKRKAENNLAKYRIPSTCVVREGKKFIISARSVVLGDIICLKVGDVVPCDCRLLSSQGLLVAFLHPDQNGTSIRTVTQKNAETMSADALREHPACAPNMLCGGSEILEGTAYAVATEIGKNTFLGSLEGFKIPAERTREKQSEGATCLHPYLRLYALLLFLLLLPMTLIGILTTKEEQGALQVFLSLTALLGTGAFAWLSLFFQIPSILLSYQSIYKEKAENRAVLKSDVCTERASSLTDVFVMGRSGFTDGKLHLYRCATGEGEQTLETEVSAQALSPLCEAFAVLKKAIQDTQTSEKDQFYIDLPIFSKELFSIGEYDTDALDVRLIFARHQEDFDRGEHLLDVSLKDRSYRLLFSPDTTRLHRCAYFEQDGEARRMNMEMQSRLNAFLASLKESGCHVYSVFREEEGGIALLGIVALREQIQLTLPSVLEELKQSGVRVSFFLKNKNDEKLLLSAMKGNRDKILNAQQLPMEERRLSSFVEKYCVFVGFAQKEILTLLNEMRRSGRRVAVLGERAEDLPLMRRSFLAVACDPTPYHKQKDDTLAKKADASNLANTLPSALRRTSDLLIHRATRLEGGLLSVLRIVSDCRAVDYRYSLIFGFLIISQLLCLVPSLLAIIFGVGLMSGGQLLFIGFVVQAAAVLWLISLSIPQNHLRKPHAFSAQHAKKLLQNPKKVLPAIASSAFVYLYSLVLFFVGAFDGQVFVSYLFGATLLLQLTALILLATESRLQYSWRSILILSSVVLLPAILASVLSMLLPSLSAFLLLGAWNLISLLSLILPPASYLLFYLLFSRIFYRTAK